MITNVTTNRTGPIINNLKQQSGFYFATKYTVYLSCEIISERNKKNKGQKFVSDYKELNTIILTSFNGSNVMLLWY